MTQERARFKPEEHFRLLKGQQYLECKWRLVWFREERPAGWVKTVLLEHDAVSGLAVFRAEVGYWDAQTEREVSATGHGSETRKDFADYLEKSETKSVGRALAMLGYGTQFAQELEEGDRIVDSPVERKAGQQRQPAQGSQRQQRAPLAVVPEPVNIDELRAEVARGLEQDAEAAAKLPKKPQEMNEAELTKTLAWLTRRARALSS